MIFYITFVNLESFGHAGVRKKIIAQSKAMEMMLGRTLYSYWNYEMAYLMHCEDVVEKEIVTTRKQYKNVLIKWIKKYAVKKTYVRYPFSDKIFIEFLKYQKENDIKTILEIPTFPYDDEIIPGRVKTEDQLYRKQVSKYVDKISTYSDDEKIWGIDCINLINGIDMDLYHISKKNEEKEMVMIASAGEFVFWNGFERIIEGMNIHKDKLLNYNIKLLLVGKGGDESLYRNLVAKYRLEDFVVFNGWHNGDDLDRIYEQADIAISSLGSYKKGIKCASPIKAGEYCARGLPIVCGYDDIRFRDKPFFVMNVPNDDSAIDIGAVIDFYNNVKSIDNYKELIRKYAENNIAWNIILSPVFEYLQC